MRKIFFLLLGSAISLGIRAQNNPPPQGLNYQAIARDLQGNELDSMTISVQFVIRQGSFTGPQVFSETHSNVLTNQFGLFNLIIGSVNPALFVSINWGNGPYFLEVIIDDGTGPQNMGVTQLWSVPYALYAGTAATAPAGPTGPVGPTGPSGLQGLSGPTGATGATGVLQNGTVAGQTPFWNGTQWIINTNIFNNGGSIGIGTITPSIHAVLDLTSTSKGFLIPRMTSAQRGAIIGPPAGLMVYQTDPPSGFYYWDGTNWWRIKSSLPVNVIDEWTIMGNSGTNPSINFIGTTDAADLTFRTSNVARMRITSVGNVGVGTLAPTSTLEIAGSTASAVTTVSSNITLTGSHSIVIVNTAGVTLTLPSAASCPGRKYYIKKIFTAGVLNIAPSGTDTIEGINSTQSFSSPVREGLIFVSDGGTGWHIIARQ